MGIERIGTKEGLRVDLFMRKVASDISQLHG